jgi:hypothetical protein
VKLLPLTLFFSAVLALPAFADQGRFLDVPVTLPTSARAAGTQKQPRIATDGRDFFAAWIDWRGGSGSVYGTRVRADGTVLDPSGILLSAPEQFCDSFALAWDGSNYVVVWQADSRVNFIRVDRDGTLLGEPQTVFDKNGADPAIASNGHGSIVISHFVSVINNMIVPQYAVALISQNGTVAQKTALSVASTNAQIASNGDGYLLSEVGPTTSTTSLFRLDNNGDPIAGSAQQLPEAAYTQLTARTGGPYLLAGRKFSGVTSCARSIVGRIVSSSGLSDPFVVHDSGGANIEDIAVTAEGSGFQVVWMKRSGAVECPYPFVDPAPPPSPPFDLAQVHVGDDGSSGAPSSLIEGAMSDDQPSIASNGVVQALVWIESDAAHQIAKVAAAIAPPGEQAVPIPIASSAAAQSEPAIAAADGLFMTAWKEERQNSGTSAIYARRFDTDGRPLDATATQVSTNDQTRTYIPSVSYDGTVWLFVWVADQTLAARRMARDGSWIDSTPMTIGPGSGIGNYAIASNGNGFAVLTVSGKPALTIIPRTGDAHEVLVPLGLGFTEFLTYPSMAWDGAAYTAVWTRGNTNDVEGIRLNQDGQIVTPRFDVARTARTEWTPSIACHDGMCVVAWYSNGSVAAARLINGVLVPFSNTAGNVIIAPAAGGYAYQPKLLTTRDGFLLLWSEWDGRTHSLLTASVTQSGIGPPVPLGSIAISSAAMTAHDQLALTIARPAYDPASGGALRAFLRVWPLGRRRAMRP